MLAIRKKDVLHLWTKKNQKGVRPRRQRKMLQAIQDLDFQILDFIQTHLRVSFLDPVMAFFTHLGSSVTWIAVIALLLFYRRTRKDALVSGIGLLGGVIFANVILKHLIARDRPCWIREGYPVLIGNPTDYSFPSGHTMAAVIFTVVMVRKHPKLAPVLIPIACLIGFSRMYLYVHFPSDVLFSIATGIPLGFLTLYLEKRIREKHSLSGRIST